MSAWRHHLTNPGIDLRQAEILAPKISAWLLENGVTTRGRGTDWAYSGPDGKDAVGAPIGPAVQQYRRDMVENVPVCVLVGWQEYVSLGGEDNVVSQCTACLGLSPDEATMRGVYDRWLTEQKTPQVTCQDCGTTQSIVERNLDGMDVVAPLAVTAGALMILDFLPTNWPDELQVGTWFISSRRI